MKLVKLLRTMNLNINKYIAINEAGDGFVFKGVEDLITDVNNSGGAANLNATKIDGKTIEEFINDLKSDFKVHEHANKDVLDTITNEKVQSWDSKQDAIGYVPEDLAKKGVAEGYASLDNTGKIPLEQLPAITKETLVVEDSNAKNALTVDQVYPGLQCLVLDDDSAKPDEQSVLYICVKITGTEITWAAIAKLDPDNVTISWDNIIGRPSSSVQDIDDAVAKKHKHDNINTLNKIGVDSEDRLTYNGTVVAFSDNPIGVLRSCVITASSDNQTVFMLTDPSYNFDKDKDNIIAVYYSGLRVPDSNYDFSKDSGNLTLKNNISLDNGELLEVEFEKF